jgi:hypothetical protein
MPPETGINTQVKSTLAPLADRRSFYRARLADSHLRVRAWRIARGTPLSHVPMPSQEVRVAVHNICIGGLGIILTGETSQPPLALTDRLRLEVMYEQISVLVEGRLRTPDAIQQDSFIRTGIRFDGNVSNFGYHKAQFWLSKIMGLAQREELKARRSAEEQATG